MLLKDTKILELLSLILQMWYVHAKVYVAL